MDEHTHLLAGTGIAALRAVLGCPVSQLLARSMEVNRSVVVSACFSLAIGEHAYCVLESDWADTRDEGLDFHMIEARIADWPKGIARVNNNNGWGMLASPSAIYPQSSAAAIARIHVLEQREAGTRESVRYDRALLFTRTDGSRFSVSTHQSIRGGLEFSEDSAVVDELLAQHAMRLVVE